FREFFHLDRYPQAIVINKTCEGLDTAEITELHQAYYGCFQGTPWQWFVVLCNGDVTHCCYDYDGTQKLGNVREQRITEIARSPFLTTIEEGFRSHDFTNLPRCAVCFKNPAARPPLTDRIWKYAQAFPIKLPFRKLLNVPPGEGQAAVSMTESTSPNRDAYDPAYYAQMYHRHWFTCPDRKWRER